MYTQRRWHEATEEDQHDQTGVISQQPCPHPLPHPHSTAIHILHTAGVKISLRRASHQGVRNSMVPERNGAKVTVSCTSYTEEDTVLV